MIYIFFIVYFSVSFLIADKIGRNKKLGFVMTLLICIFLSPFIGFLISENSALKFPIGCNWCGNNDNEARYCGICGKDINGELKKV
jgi:hypothetical protein